MMLIHVRATMDVMVAIDESEPIVAENKARNLVTADNFEILQEDLANSMTEDVFLGTRIIKDKSDLPNKWGTSIPWSDEVNDETRTCNVILDGAVVFKDGWWENCTDNQSKTVCGDLLAYENEGHWKGNKIPTWCKLLAQHLKVESEHLRVLETAWKTVAKHVIGAK